MLNKILSDKDKKMLISYLGKAYLNTVIRVEIQQIQGVKENSNCYQGELHSIQFIEIALENIDETSRLILKNEFFSKSDKNWYLEYFSKSTFYRLKKRAIDKFIDCLSI